MADVAAPVFKKRANKSANIRKRPPTPPPAERSDSDASDYTDGEEEGVRVKRRKTQGVSLSTAGPQSSRDLSKSTVYAADRSTHIAVNEDATKESNWYTDSALVALEGGNDKKSNLAKAAAVTPAEESNGAYRGSSSYSSFIDKNPDGPGRHVGPVKAPTNVRAITVTDFAPDVCKDYKTTGYCGFGDSCKFLHAREDYKQGWQLDKEWENVGVKGKGKGKADATAAAADVDPEEKMLQEIPFACIICKGTYKNPVATKCGHYFCQKCAMGRYQREKKRTCAACGADTAGSFAVARKLKDLLEKKRRRVRERKEQAREAGEDVSSSSDDDDDDDDG
jgi:RING finger protein 113A